LLDSLVADFSSGITLLKNVLKIKAVFATLYI